MNRAINIIGFSQEARIPAGILMTMLGEPLECVSDASTFAEALQQFLSEEGGSDEEAAARLRTIELFPARLEEVRTSQEAYELFDLVIGVSGIEELVMPILEKWLSLSSTTEELTRFIFENQDNETSVKGAIKLANLLIDSAESAQIAPAIAALYENGAGLMYCKEDMTTLVKKAFALYELKEATPA